MNDLIKNIDRLHTTEMGVTRIKKNLSIDTDDVVAWCRMRILDEAAVIERRGKNWYISFNDDTLHFAGIITVNAHSYTVITAHRV